MDLKRIDRMSVDLAALQTLRMVFDTNSFSAAARALDVNPSTVSYTMDRLRLVFNDPLFVRSGRGVIATERCAEIAEGAREILQQYSGISQPQVFDPASASFKVVFALNHKERAILMTRVVRYLRRNAPGVALQIVYGHKHGHARLREGECDFLITPDELESSSLYRKHLYSDPFVCVVDRCSTFAKAGISLEQYIAARHILVSFEGMYRPPFQAWLEQEGLRYVPSLDLSSTSEIERFVRGTDLVATVPARLARTYDDRVAVIEAPFDQHADTYMYWTSRTHRAQNMRWIRDLVVKAANCEGELQ